MDIASAGRCWRQRLDQLRTRRQPDRARYDHVRAGSTNRGAAERANHENIVSRMYGAAFDDQTANQLQNLGYARKNG